MCGREVFYGNFAVGEYTLALRLESELSDLRAGYANPCACKQTLLRFRARGSAKREEAHQEMCGREVFYGNFAVGKGNQ